MGIPDRDLNHAPVIYKNLVLYVGLHVKSSICFLVCSTFRLRVIIGGNRFYSTVHYGLFTFFTVCPCD